MDYGILAENMMESFGSLLQVPAIQGAIDMARGDLGVMNYLLMHDNSAYPKQMSDVMAISTARVAAILNRLERMDLICRSPDGRDNRKIIVRLTEKGIDSIKQKRENLKQVLADVLDMLGEEDAQHFIRIQKRISQNFKEAKIREELMHL